MDSALTDWLSLREPADRAARSQAVTQTVLDAIDPGAPVRVLDLATGTGANVRYIVDRLRGRQHWLCIDRDPALLAELPARMSSWGTGRGYEVEAHASGCLIRGEGLECRVETRQGDLGALEDGAIFTGRHLVTASALLDLVSVRWLRVLASRCRSVGASALFALTYDGRSACSPVEHEDDIVRDLMNRHQKTDKGLGGPAAGPDAADRVERCFVDAGYLVHRAPSDWTLEPADAPLQRMLIEGWAEAAAEMAPDLASAIAGWRLRRLGHVAAGRSRVVVSHSDVCAWRPPVR
jgi:hypothetical protein